MLAALLILSTTLLPLPPLILLPPTLLTVCSDTVSTRVSPGNNVRCAVWSGEVASSALLLILPILPLLPLVLLVPLVPVLLAKALPLLTGGAAVSQVVVSSCGIEAGTVLIVLVGTVVAVLVFVVVVALLVFVICLVCVALLMKI